MASKAFPGDPSSARQTANRTSPLQENLHRVRSRASNGLSFHSRPESRPYVYIICDDGSSWPFKKWNYPPATLSNPSSQRFGDASGFIRNEQGADRQFNWFVPNKAKGRTQAGLSRLNQSIEAPVYCALGAQVNVQSSILGNGGRAKEAQSEFLASLERSTRQTDLSKGVRRYQLPIDEGKLRLDLAAAPRAWLMPFRMVINTERTDAYNNKLKQATPNMELGLTNDVNKETQQWVCASWTAGL